ncbi:S8 family serine peptidase [Rhodopila sp.]|uniref:S8 family serine peptidase n=1 Tax=Rhodopila sp. TaxID=2480087 RepID=UPI003D10C97A
MQRSGGCAEVAVALIDGPVAQDHPALAQTRIEPLGPPVATTVPCTSAACAHGTFIAGILGAQRGGMTAGICPDCTLLLRPIFAGDAPCATAAELADAIIECTNAGARVINISAALGRAGAAETARLSAVLDHAMRRGAVVAAAAGNDGAIGGSALTRHPWVIAVAGSDRAGRPLDDCNLGHSIGRGLAAPGERMQGLGPAGATMWAGGSSTATALVSGAAALLASLARGISAAALRAALVPQRRPTLVPPLLDAAAAWQTLTGAEMAS